MSCTFCPNPSATDSFCGRIVCFAKWFGLQQQPQPQSSYCYDEEDAYDTPSTMTEEEVEAMLQEQFRHLKLNDAFVQ
jgi:hypothetical protein